MRTKFVLGLLVSLCVQLKADWGDDYPLCANYMKQKSVETWGINCNSDDIIMDDAGDDYFSAANSSYIALLRKLMVSLNDKLCNPPRTCSCYSRKHEDSKRKNVVDCSGNSLTEVPVGLPVDTEVLLLHDNNFVELRHQDIALAISLDFTVLSNLTAEYRRAVQDFINATVQANSTDSMNFNISLPVLSEIVRPASDLKLRKLYLHNNPDLAQLHDGAFDSLPNLEKLTLHHTAVSSMTRSVFHDIAPSLQLLWMQDNDVEYIEAGTLDNFTSLKHLWLHENDISKFPPRMFETMPSLRELRMQDNVVSNLTCCTMCGLQHSNPDLYADHNSRSLECGCGDAAHECADCFDKCVKWDVHFGSGLVSLASNTGRGWRTSWSVNIATAATAVGMIALLYHQKRLFHYSRY